jgi:Holliday junction DNA helicase RuvA
VWTHLAVREDAHNLYGFTDKETLDFFELLITISGIGPKSALSILSAASVDAIKKAVISGEVAYLTKVAGIGRRTAEKIVLELKEKIGALTSEGTAVQEEVDVIEALKALGYSHMEARDAVKKVPETVTGTGERVKAALKLLGR